MVGHRRLALSTRRQMRCCTFHEVQCPILGVSGRVCAARASGVIIGMIIGR